MLWLHECYFGAKKANESLHALYTYDTGTVTLDNLTNTTQSGVSVQSKVYDLAGKLLDDQTVSGVTLGAQGVLNRVLRPRVPASTRPPTPARTYFVELQLDQDGQTVDRNVYWLSTQQDIVNWPETIGRPQATVSQYANLTQLRSLPTARVTVSAVTQPQAGPDGTDTVTNVTITNTSTTPTVAFFLRADVRRGSVRGSPAPGDNEVLPIFWSDNDIALWPGESQTLHASYRRSGLRGAAPTVSVSGWNLPAIDLAARSRQ